eukprot:493302_1
MVREILTISVGQCGIQLGHRVWQQYNVEHLVSASGHKEKTGGRCFQCCYQQTKENTYLTRNLMIDTDPDSISQIKSSKYAAIYNPDCLVSCEQDIDSANIFARGYYIGKKHLIQTINDRIRQSVENCDNIQAFMMNHSVGGGTGSGLGSLIMEQISVDYRKKLQIGFDVYPFNNHLSTTVVEPYNALLSTRCLLQHTDMSYVFDNRKIYNLCQSYLNIEKPTFLDMNTYCAKIISSETRQERYDQCLSVDLNEKVTNLVPFPNLHFLTTSLAPVVQNIDTEKVLITRRNSILLVDGFVRYYYPFNSLQTMSPLYDDVMNLIYEQYKYEYSEYNKIYYDINSVSDLFEMCCDPNYFLIECNDFDEEQDQYFAININCNGDINYKQANNSWNSIKNKMVTMLKWCPSGCKIGLEEDKLPRIDENDNIIHRDKMLEMCGNNTMIARFFQQRVYTLSQKMWKMRAYIHWFCVHKSMEESEFREAMEDMCMLQNDYEDSLLDTCDTDYDDSDSDC